MKRNLSKELLLLNLKPLAVSCAYCVDHFDKETLDKESCTVISNKQDCVSKFDKMVEDATEGTLKLPTLY